MKRRKWSGQRRSSKPYSHWEIMVIHFTSYMIAKKIIWQGAERGMKEALGCWWERSMRIVWMNHSQLNHDPLRWHPHSQCCNWHTSHRKRPVVEVETEERQTEVMFDLEASTLTPFIRCTEMGDALPGGVFFIIYWLDRGRTSIPLMKNYYLEGSCRTLCRPCTIAPSRPERRRSRSSAERRQHPAE